MAKKLPRRERISMIQEAANLVDRARQGDKNAMAMIVQVKKRANQGILRAKFAEDMIRDYIDKHPIVGAEREISKPVPNNVLAAMKNEDRLVSAILEACKYKNGFLAASLVLSYLGPLNKPRIQEFGNSSFGSEEKTQSFFWGVVFPHEDHYHAIAWKIPPEMAETTRIGQVFGRARKLQALRKSGSRISDWDKRIGWEMGE